MNFSHALRLKPGRVCHLSDWKTDDTSDYDKDRAREKTAKNTEHLFKSQTLLAAESKRALLIILQGMDTAGKDGVIRNVMRGLNPQSCSVKSFKEPSSEELRHDFLWRVHAAIPPHGTIGIFNRSHYEDVLVARVKNLAPKHVWHARYEQINAFENMLTQNGVTVLKFFLHISKEEQKARLEERLKDPAKNWKLSPSDLKDRALWKDYKSAYEDALSRCSTKPAPWFIIPADKKWFRDLAISEIICTTLDSMDLKYPRLAFSLKSFRIP